MQLRTPILRALFLLSSMLLVATRVTGAHVHYCRDGAQPPVALHYVDSAQGEFHEHDEVRDHVVEHFHHAEPGHSDLVVAVGAEAPPQKLLAFADPQALPPAEVLSVQLPEVSAWLLLARPEWQAPAPRWFALQPPVRGPPA